MTVLVVDQVCSCRDRTIIGDIHGLCVRQSDPLSGVWKLLPRLDQDRGSPLRHESCVVVKQVDETFLGACDEGKSWSGGFFGHLGT